MRARTVCCVLTVQINVISGTIFQLSQISNNSEDSLLLVMRGSQAEILSSHIYLFKTSSLSHHRLQLLLTWGTYVLAVHLTSVVVVFALCAPVCCNFSADRGVGWSFRLIAQTWVLCKGLKSDITFNLGLTPNLTDIPDPNLTTCYWRQIKILLSS